MKKTVGIVLALMLTLSLFACKQAGNTSTAGSEAETAVATAEVTVEVTAAGENTAYPGASEEADSMSDDANRAEPYYREPPVNDGETVSGESSAEGNPDEQTQNYDPETLQATSGISEENDDGKNSKNESPDTTAAGAGIETQPETSESDITEAPTQSVSVPAETKPENNGGSSFMEKYGNIYLIISIIVMLAMAAAIVILVLKRKSSVPQVPSPDDAGYPDNESYPPTEEDINPATPPDPDQTVPVKAVSVHNIGRRKNQEDSFGVSETKDGALYRRKGVMAVVADGMGGLSGGENVSSMAVLSMLQGFSDLQATGTGEDELKRLLDITVRKVNQYLENGVGLKQSGSTLMAVIIREKMLSWISVGDSRTALFRNGKLSDLNRRHTYGEELDALVRQNKISAAQANSNPDREKLTSYIGMGNLKHVDKSARPMPLKKGDKIILMSDGVFNTLPDDEIEQILSLPTDSISETLNKRIRQKANPHQDNYTAVVLEIL